MIVEFQCSLQNTNHETVDWRLRINGTTFESVHPSFNELRIVCNTSESDGSTIYHVFIPVQENGTSNNTEVKCVVIYPRSPDGNNAETNSQIGTIVIQGM